MTAFNYVLFALAGVCFGCSLIGAFRDASEADRKQEARDAADELIASTERSGPQ